MRVASRSSGGVRGIRLREDAELIALVADCDGDDLLVVTELGMGKRTPIAEYSRKGRGGQGMLTFRVSEQTGPIAVAAIVTEDEELMLISTNGVVMRTPLQTISQQGRSTRGVRVVNLDEDDRVASLARINLGAGSGDPTDGDKKK